MQAQARVAELSSIGEWMVARLECAGSLAPAPGCYILAHEQGSSAPLSTALFAADYGPTGFSACPPFPAEWRPGTVLHLRGPLGRGFQMPPASRRAALVSLGNDAMRLLPLARAALRQEAAVALVCDDALPDLPPQIEIQPLSALREVCGWCDYAALDVDIESLNGAARNFLLQARFPSATTAQALVRAPMPCGGLAACGVCSVRTTKGTKWACLDGPVFDLHLLLTER